MIDEEFIETVISPVNKEDNTERQNTMISRELYGMEAVAQFNEEGRNDE